MVFTRCVSSRMDTTIAGCQPDDRGILALVTVVPLFAPRIAVAVVTIHLPESRLVVVHEAQAPDPLGGLPEIEMRHQEARGPAVLGCERLAVVFPDHVCLSVQHILD